MIYSKTSEYAIRILIYFAKTKSEKPIKVKEISRVTRISSAYSAKVLLCLVKNKFLTSDPGPTGGFSVKADLSKLTVSEVLAAVDDFPKSQFSNCVMGLNECNSSDPCILHDPWMETRDRILGILSKTTIQDLVKHPSNFRLGLPKRITLSRSMRSVFGYSK